MKTIKLIGLSILFLVSNSCAFNKQGHLTKRYHKATPSGKDNKVGVEVKAYVFSPEAPSKSPKTFFDLTDSVQKYLILAYAQKDTSSAQLNQSIANPFTAKQPLKTDPFFDDRTCFKKRIVFSVRNKSLKPDDRIWKLDVKLTKIESGKTKILRFSNCSQLVTEFETIDIGKLTFSNKSSLSATANASTEAGGSGSSKQTDEDGEVSATTTNKATAGANVTGSTEAAFAEEMNLRQRRVKLSAFVSEDTLSIYQEGIVGIDLTGNIFADVEMCAFKNAENAVFTQRVYEFSNLKKADSANAPDKINIRFFTLLSPDINGNITAKISGTAVIRRVLSNGNTSSEGDDKVAFEEVNIPEQDITLLHTRELTPNFWFIQDGTGNAIKIKGLTDRNFNELRFRSFEDAANFLIWLKTVSSYGMPVGGLLPGGYQLGNSDGSALTDNTFIQNLSINIIVN